MLPSLVTLDQLADRMTIEDDTAAEAAIADASALVRLVARTNWVNEESELQPVPDPIQVVVLGAVQRYLKNPDGYSSIQVSQFAASTRGAASAVFLTDAEKDLIRAVVRVNRIYSIAIEVDGLARPPVIDEESPDLWQLMT
jgi:hypothetical protein